MPLCCEGHVQLGENRHGGYVASDHLDSKRCLYFIFRRCGFDYRERSIHGEF